MIRYTFLGDGSSDKAIMKIIYWAFSDKYPEITLSAQFGELRHLEAPVKILKDKIIKVLDLYPCDILFVHRDAEDVKNAKQIFSKRKTEIQNAVGKTDCVYVAVIPIKMMETWLLTDEMAIRKAAGNRNSTVTIGLPPISKLEILPNPKEKLHEFLKSASGLKGRRLDSFNVGQAIHRVAESTDDFSRLRTLYSFRKFEEELETVVVQILNSSKE